MEALISILRRATATGKGSELDRPRDSDVITAATAVLDRGFGKPGPDRSFQHFVGEARRSAGDDPQRRVSLPLPLDASGC